MDPAGKTAAGARGSQQLLAVQQALKEKGHDPGPIDGLMGPRTSAALRDFQSKEGIQPTGKPDKQTLASLGVEATSGSGESGKK